MAVIVLGWTWVAWLVVLGAAADASEEIWRDAVDKGLTYQESGAAPFVLATLPVPPFLVAVFVVVGLWLHRSRRFGEEHSPRSWFSLRIAWTWLGWVVPLVSLWFPAWVVSDVWRATLRRRVAWYLFPWWGCWLLMLLLAFTAVNRLGGSAGNGVLDDRVLLMSEQYIASAVLGLFACWAWTAIVMRVRRGQLALAGGSAPDGDGAVG
ncbi:DUF4328 domain-containing protein [Promicromonospora sp. NFX87]|uniref:DUF4328 domain-containing protein n=1 Tax=Promicromonospora sp. NFX87 TaxID=3402691 RepID=UPI003AFB67C1